jgi:hypothetical protein
MAEPRDALRVALQGATRSSTYGCLIDWEDLKNAIAQDLFWGTGEDEEDGIVLSADRDFCRRIGCDLRYAGYREFSDGFARAAAECRQGSSGRNCASRGGRSHDDVTVAHHGPPGATLAAFFIWADRRANHRRAISPAAGLDPQNP